MELLEIYVLIVVFFPLIGSLMVGLNCRFISNIFSHSITTVMVFISAFFSCKILYLFSIKNCLPFETTLYTWGQVHGIKFEVGFLIDRLTAIMLFIVSFISFLVHLYTIGYMRGDSGYNRFFSYISFFTFAMLMLVVSNNFLQLFFGWEGVGLASYLLIGFWFKKPTAIFANLKAFIVNRVGDLGFLLGIAAVFCCFGTLNYNQVFLNVTDLISDNSILLNTFVSLDAISAVTFISICLFIGAMGKSAQVPLHVWLPDSMEGPTPISALIHAATMVTAGIFMVARMSPIFEHSQSALAFILIIGVITCFFMGLLGIVQNDIKRIVAYSTLSQLGLMVTALGVSAYSAAIFHLITHAFFKALLFLGAGSVIVALHHEQDIRYMGNLKKYMPITYLTMLIGSFALVGIPGFAGFFSKDLIIECVYSSNFSFSFLVYYCLILCIFITSFYSFRMFFLVFHTESRVKLDINLIKESRYVITIPLLILAFFSLISGWFFFNFVIQDYFNSAIFVKNSDVYNNLLAGLVSSKHLFFHGIISLPFFMSSLGILTAWFLYCFNTNLVNKLRCYFSVIYDILVHKYGFDALNKYFIMFGVRNFGVFLWKVGDIFLIDTIIVNGVAWVLKLFSLFFRKIQTGYLYNYVYVMATGFMFVLIGMMSF